MRAVASAFYWWGVGWLLYMLVAGDRFPLDREPGLWEVYGPVTLVVVGAIVVNALLVHFDRRRSWRMRCRRNI
jgi:hypothetical protein